MEVWWRNMKLERVADPFLTFFRELVKLQASSTCFSFCLIYVSIFIGAIEIHQTFHESVNSSWSLLGWCESLKWSQICGLSLVSQYTSLNCKICSLPFVNWVIALSIVKLPVVALNIPATVKVFPPDPSCVFAAPCSVHTAPRPRETWIVLYLHPILWGTVLLYNRKVTAHHWIHPSSYDSRAPSNNRPMEGLVL